MRTTARRGQRGTGFTLGNRLHALLRRWSLSGFRLGAHWLENWFGKASESKQKPMFPRAKLELYPLEDRYHPNDPLGMLHTQVLGVLAWGGMDLTPALTRSLLGDVSDTGIVHHARAGVSVYEGPAEQEALWNPRNIPLPEPESGGGAPASDLHLDLSGVGAPSSEWSMGNDLWYDPFAGGTRPGASSGVPAFAPASGLSNSIISPPAGFGASPSGTGGAGYSAPSNLTNSGSGTSSSGYTNGASSALVQPKTWSLQAASTGTSASPTPSSPPILGGGPTGPDALEGDSGITEYTVGNNPRNIVSGPDNNLWVTWNDPTHPVLKVTTTGTATGMGTGTTSYSYDIVKGPDGLLWYTAQKTGTPNVGKIGKITTAGTVTEYTLANSSDPRGITVGADGNLWFTEYDHNAIGKITTSGTVTEYTIPTASSGPEDITAGVDGNLWFTERSTNKVAKVTTSGSFTEYSVPTASSAPFGITSGPDGNIWFTENSGNKVVRSTLSGTMTEFTVPTASSSPKGIAPGPDGNLWFVEYSGNQLASITPAGAITEYFIPTLASGATGVGTGPDGSIWFTEYSKGKVAKLDNVPTQQLVWDLAGQAGSGIASEPVGVRVPIGEWTAATGNGDVRRQHALDLNLNPSDYADANMGGAVALTYNSDTNSPKPVVAIAFSTDPNGSVPTSIVGQLTWNGGAGSAVTFSTTGHAAGDTYLIGLQVNSAVTMTSVYSWSVLVTAAYSGGTNVVHSGSGKTPIIVNGTSGPEGAGWSLAAVDKLVAANAIGGALLDDATSDVMWVRGDGIIRYYQSFGNNAFLSPPDDFGTMVLNVDGTYTYTAKDQTKWNFNSSGLLTSVVNPEGLTRTYTYSAGLLSTVTDPDGGVGTFNYTTGLLSSINEPGGRNVTLTYSSGYLSTIKDPDSSLETFTWDASHRINNDQHGPLNTTISYDSTSGLPNNFNQGLGVSTTIVSEVAQGLATSPANNVIGGVITDGLGHLTTYTLQGVAGTVKIKTADNALQAQTINFAAQPPTSTDPLNNVTTSTFDYNTGKGDVTKITNADGSTEQFQYDGTFHHLTVYVDGNGNRTTLAYDATTGDLTTFTNALNQTTTFAYYQTGGKDNGLVRSMTDALGNTTSFAYDTNRRMTQRIDGYGTSVATTATMIYDSAGNLLSETTGISSTASYDHHATTSFAYDAMRRVTQVIEGYGSSLQRTTTISYDGIGDALTTTDPLSHIVSYAYDQVARPTTRVDAYGTSVAVTATMIYDNASNLTSETTGISSTASYDHHATTSFGYDAVNRVNQVIAGYGTSVSSTATMIYDLAGNLLSETDGSSTTTSYDHHTTTSFGYDVMNRQNKVITGYGTSVASTATMIYDNAANLLSETDGISTTTSYDQHVTTSYGYDALNRVQAVVEGFGTSVSRTSTIAFDAGGNTQALTDPLNHTTTFGYDALNRRITTTDALGKITTSTFDAAGNQVTLKDPDSNSTTFTFDALNRLTQQTDALNHSATFAYSATDHLTSTTDRNGRLRTMSYDALDRETGETWQVSGSTVNTQTFTYDAAGNALTAADGNGAYTMTYDVLNRMTSVQEPYSQALTFTYDAARNRATRTDSQSGTATETYDSLNRLVSYQYSVSGVATLMLTQAWNAGNHLTTQSRYSDLTGTTLVGTTSYGYDASGRETNLQFKDGSGNNISNFTYSYDSASRLTAETLNGTTTSYQYDNDNQLTQSGTATFGYDSNGNRTNTGYTTGTENELTNDGTWTYTYDNEGNLTQKSKGANLDTFTYTYDNLNRLTGVTETNGGSTVQQLAFKYDVLGNRIDMEVTVNSVTTATHFAYDGMNAWADLSGSNALQTRRLYLDAPDALFARISSSGTAAWYLTDRLGSVRDLANNTTGASIDHLDYGDGFGKVTNETNSANGDRYKFAGGELDSQTGEMRFGLRYYDPPTGRWLTQDPIGFGGGDPNLYRDVGNSPTNFTDPTGLTDQITIKPKNPGVPGGKDLVFYGSTYVGYFECGNVVRDGYLITLEDVKAEAASWWTTSNWAKWIKQNGKEYGTNIVDMADQVHSNSFQFDPQYASNAATAGKQGATLAKVGVAMSPMGLPFLPAGTAINITKSGIAHATERHIAGGALSAGKSLFSKGEDISALVRAAESVRAVRQAGGNYERIVDAGRIIGVDRTTGQSTSTYTVITTQSGNLVTSFPGKPTP